MPHIHEKIDFTVEVFIVHKDKVLLRLHDKYGIWLSVGGHIELDEDPTEAALREVKEEVGLDVALWDGNMLIKTEITDYRDIIPPVGMYRNRINETHEHIALVYFATSTTDQLILEKDSDEAKWYTREEVATMDLRDSIRDYALKALDVLVS